MKRWLVRIFIGVFLLGVAFGGGWLSRRDEVVRLVEQRVQADHERTEARQALARQSVSYDLCRAAEEAAHDNFGNAAERLTAAKQAASQLPELQPLGPRFDEALGAARGVQAQAREKIERLLHDVAK